MEAEMGNPFSAIPKSVRAAGCSCDARVATAVARLFCTIASSYSQRTQSQCQYIIMEVFYVFFEFFLRPRV